MPPTATQTFKLGHGSVRGPSFVLLEYLDLHNLIIIPTLFFAWPIKPIVGRNVRNLKATIVAVILVVNHCHVNFTKK